jgi:hypothetical protein
MTTTFSGSMPQKLPLRAIAGQTGVDPGNGTEGKMASSRRALDSLDSMIQEVLSSA